MRTLAYPVRCEPGDKPGISMITFRDVPETITQGESEEDAL